MSPPYSTRNVEFCRSPNADEVIDYTTIDDMSSALRNKGVRLDRIVMPIGISALMHPSRIIIKARRCVFAKQLTTAGEWINQGEMNGYIDQVLGFGEVMEAFGMMQCDKGTS
ncbi:uncharacterized protein MCYG_06121 [Microsporum canis CBS 113480]|uniref:Uncharacterized protein n=1 Tax=Arthroderma otae (strain ATCC MYA-4605 / CBS 113480) TaxID=554155 RepID=C5FTU9_ARTOC|nr:uncharacterized protein MCYG_06121 [Microsporum canis CBS 113480]EEQ33302.1 predicted protein [Microsporum canis CBS 113480]